MKKIALSIFATLLFHASENATAQSVNWRSLKSDQPHIADLHVGLDNGFIAGIGYGHKLKIKQPALINAEFSIPFGKNLTDDFKAKLGGGAEVARIENVSFSVGVHGIFRRYQSELVRLAGFGSEFVAVAGYYRPKWYVAGEFGFDKAIITHIKNSPIMKEYYPGGQDGWYIPTGGNFFYGIKSGLSIKNCELYVKMGKTISEDLKTTATLPVYCQVGANVKFNL